MHFEAIDRVLLPVADWQKAIAPFDRLGLRCAPPLESDGDRPSGRCVFFGRAQSLFHLEIAESSGHPLSSSIQTAVDEGRGLCGLVLRVRHLQSTLEYLAGKGIAHSMHGGALAKLAIDDAAGAPLILCQSSPDRAAEVEAEDGLNHALPIRRLDHLAAVATNLDGQTHFWTDILNVPLFGEVVTPTLVICQFKIGDAIFELLGPASADSPIHKRAPGLISMMSLEVVDLNSAYTQAKAAGFSIPEPSAGALPGTIFATIPATEMSGLAVQLLQYV